MTPERWQQVKQLFDSALQYGPAQRSAFLSGACGGDEALRLEVESLIASHERTGRFIDSPAYEAAAETLISEKSELTPGQTVGDYEIVSFISRGGMGEVYLAHDRRLNRKVALKLLPTSFTKDDERLRRFEQEARAASALNHPNIITIYEILKTKSTDIIATEFVEGETLRQRLSHSPLTLRESLNVAIQIADALAAAHKAGIIHRDIKPENVMLRPDGYVKVLDFGLAKLAEKSGPGMTAEALTKQVRTGSGVVMGTAGYMSPEQARGKEVDARSDIFSLGAVLYEMVAQHKPFDGETPSDVLAAILKTDPPPLSRFVADAPTELVRIVTKALRKDREERYQVVKDMLLDLKSLRQELEFQTRLRETGASEASQPAAGTAGGRAPGSREIIHPVTRTDEIKGASPTTISKPAQSLMLRARRWPLFALIAIAVGALSFGLYALRHRSPAAVRGAAPAPTVANVARITIWSGLDTQPTLSPDGNSIAYSSDHKGSFEIYIKQLTPGGREIQLTSDGQENFQPKWSPDGKLIAYYSKNRGGIWVLPAFGGQERQLTDFGSSPDWSHDGSMIAFQSDANPDLGSGSVGSSTIWIVAAQGGTPKQVTSVGHPAGGHVGPTWSPQGRRITFVALGFTNQELWSVAVNGDDLKQMTHDIGKAGYPVYSPDGRSLYFTTGPILWCLPIEAESGALSGDPVKVTDVGASFVNSLTIAADGKRLAYNVQTLTSNIWSLPVSTTTSEATGPPQPITNQTGTRNNQPAFSPDGRKIAFMEFLRGGGADIWVADADGKNPTQLTTNTRNLIPSWFPDGDQIAFVSNRTGHWSVWATSMQSRRDRPLYDLGRDTEYPRLSPDGKRIAFNLADSGIINTWTVSLPDGQPKRLTFDKELAGFSCWSPDGKFLALQVKRGDDTHLVLQPSEGGELTQLTFGHGRSWPYSFSPDGDKIVFAGERGGGWNIWWVSRSTKAEKQLTHYTKLNAFVRYPHWSPLGNQIAYEYAETTGNIWLVELR
jgi:Tol biopolymer transport system component/serine/threonine protein kinase